jgi:hypothetical protein
MSKWWILAVLIAQTVSQVPRDVAVLDLTTPAPPQDPTKMRMFSQSVFSHPVPGTVKRWPIQVTVLDAVSEQNEPDWIVFETRIEALQTISVPRARDRMAVDPEPTKSLPSLKEMHLRVKVDGTAPGHGATAPAEMLSGSNVVPESLITLRPGESIKTRQRAWIGSVRKLAPPGAALRVRSLIHTYEDSQTLTDVLSDNAVEVRPPRE